MDSAKVMERRKIGWRASRGKEGEDLEYWNWGKEVKTLENRY